MREMRITAARSMKISFITAILSLLSLSSLHNVTSLSVASIEKWAKKPISLILVKAVPDEKIDDFNGLDVDLIGNNPKRTSSKKRKTPFPPYPPEAFDMYTLPEDAKTPKSFPELRAMDFYRSSRLLKERSYARKNRFFEIDKMSCDGSQLFQPTIQDLSSPAFVGLEKVWVTSYFRIGVITISGFIFPLVTQFLYAQSVGIARMEEAMVVDSMSFLPAVSLVYGAFITLTLQILYERQRYILEQIEMETSLLTVITQNIISIFEGDDERGVEAAQCITDHTRILVAESRGTELMTMIYDDPFIRLLNLLTEKRRDQIQKTGISESLIDFTRDTTRTLFQVRSKRLGGESSCLPPTHFSLLFILTAIWLSAFAISTIPDLDSDGLPSNATRVMFSLITTMFVIFYQFAIDLNNPFKGVYQIRRSGSAAQLLQNQMLLMRNPMFRGKISFFDD